MAETRLNYERLIAFRPPPAQISYSRRDVQYYALAVGAGADLPSEQALPFVYEKGLRPLHSYYSVLAWADPSWLWNLGITMTRMVQAGERLEIFAPLAPEGRFAVEGRIGTVIDRGPEKGLIVEAVSELRGLEDNRLIARATSPLYCLADGGLAGAPRLAPPPGPRPPARAADGEVEFTTRADQAALYRLSGDLNPIHIDPHAAAGLGLKRPLLHGLCTLGISFHQLARNYPEVAEGAVKSLEARFSAMVFPGETLKIRHWREGAQIHFETGVGEDRVVLKGGMLGLA